MTSQRTEQDWTAISETLAFIRGYATQPETSLIPSGDPKQGYAIVRRKFLLALLDAIETGKSDVIGDDVLAGLIRHAELITHGRTRDALSAELPRDRTKQMLISLPVFVELVKLAQEVRASQP